MECVWLRVGVEIGVGGDEVRVSEGMYGGGEWAQGVCLLLSGFRNSPQEPLTNQGSDRKELD